MRKTLFKEVKMGLKILADMNNHTGSYVRFFWGKNLCI